jgi:DNA polymerase III delta prime subunit
MNLMQKYSPKSIDEIILDDKILDPIISWANGHMQGFPNMQKPAILLHGKAGTGKTLTARCLCNDCEWNIIEINASSVRTKEQLKNLINIPRTDFFGRKTCLFLDETDSIEGGESTIKTVIMKMRFPVILCANEQYKVPKVLRDICEPVQFFRPSVKALKQHVLKINREEGLSLPDDVLTSAAESQDYRAAYNILEARQVLTQKEKNMTLADCTKNLMYNEECKFEDTKSILYFLDENAPKLYDILDLYDIFEKSIKSDKYNRRGQTNFANLIIKEIPKTTMEIEEIHKPILYLKNKNQKKFNPT